MAKALVRKNAIGAQVDDPTWQSSTIPSRRSELPRSRAFVANGIVSHQDMLPTLLAAAGDPKVSEKLLNGYKIGDKTYKVHIDGINVLPCLTGEVKESQRDYFFYVSDDGGIMGLRVRDYKLAFEVQNAVNSNVWAEPFVKLRGLKFVGGLMSCMLCTSDNQAEFTAEIMIHLSGRRNIDNPGVLSFPKIAVCLDCGFSEFAIPEAELQKLKAMNARSTTAA